MVAASRSPDRSRNGGPGRVVFDRGPDEPQVGLEFEPGEIVVFELRTHDHAQRVIEDLDLVLEECAEELSAAR